MSYPNPKFTATELVPEQSYRISRAFKDYDGVFHPAGEYWRFVKKNFLPYDDGLTLYIEKDGQELSFRLQWRTESQGQLIDHFSDYVEKI